MRMEIPGPLAKAAALVETLRANARRCRRTALGMPPSLARSAIERTAAHWELMAAVEAYVDPYAPANEP
jgi:hypothetical protein